MNLDEWYLECEQVTKRFVLDMRKLTKQLPEALRLEAQETSKDDVVASTHKPDVQGQERLHLSDPLDLIA